MINQKMKELTGIQCLYLLAINRWGSGRPVSCKFIENFSMSIRVDPMVWEEVLKVLVDKGFLIENVTGYLLTEKANNRLNEINTKTLFVDRPELRASPVVSAFLG